MSECATLATRTQSARAALEGLRANAERSIAPLKTEHSEDLVARRQAVEARESVRQLEAQQFAVAFSASNPAQSVMEVHALRDRLNGLGRDVDAVRSPNSEVAREVRELSRQVAGSALQASAQRPVEDQTAEWATSAQHRALEQRLDETVATDVINAAFDKRFEVCRDEFRNIFTQFKASTESALSEQRE